MINIKRQEARKVDFSDVKLRKPMLDKKEKDIGKKEDYIKKKFSQLKDAEQIISNIHNEIQIKTSDIAKKEQEIQKMAGLWNDMNNICIKDLKEEEVKKIVNSQKGFIRDLLEHYIDSTKKEKEYLGKIEELEKENDRLINEIDDVMSELEKLQ